MAFKRKPPQRRVAQPGLEAGSHIWFLGMRMVVTKLDRDRGLVWHSNGYFNVVHALRDLTHNEGLKVWTVNGREGPTPKFVRGVLVDPELRRCEDCDSVTHRRGGKCSSCIIKEAQGV